MTNAEPTDVPLCPEFLIGDRMRKAREVSGISQSKLCEALGVNRNRLSRIENNKESPTLDHVRIVADRTGVDYNWLLLDQSRSISRYPLRGRRITATGRLISAV